MDNICKSKSQHLFLVKCAEMDISKYFYKSVWQLSMDTRRGFILFIRIVNLSCESTLEERKKTFAWKWWLKD